MTLAAVLALAACVLSALALFCHDLIADMRHARRIGRGRT